jgi:hypothetical protein
VRKLIGAAAVAALTISGAAVMAQESKTKTKISVEDGREVTLTGCLERSAEHGFMLSRAAGKDGAVGSYLLVGDEADDLDDRVGHRVEIRGKAADQGGGKLRIESKSEVESSSGDRRTRESKTEVEGDLEGLPYMGVESIRTIATVCR